MQRRILIILRQRPDAMGAFGQQANGDRADGQFILDIDSGGMEHNSALVGCEASRIGQNRQQVLEHWTGRMNGCKFSFP
jgi:hypothetical protein